MSDTSEPKWERVEPPNFDDDDLPKKDRFPLPQKPEELDPNSELVKEEVKHLFKAEKELDDLTASLRMKHIDSDDGKNLYTLVHYDPDFRKVISNLEPFSGIGTGQVTFSLLGDQYNAQNNRFKTPYQIIVSLHTDDSTMDQAGKLFKSNPSQQTFSTRFLFGENGEIEITSGVPSNFQDPRFPNNKREHDQNSLKTALTPITANKLELAGAAIQSLTARVKSVHEIATTPNNPPSNTKS